MGRDKASLAVAGRPMLARVVSAIAEVVDIVVVAAAPGQELPELAHDVRIVRDNTAHRGPLVALEQAFGELPSSVEHAFVCGSDLPWLEPSVVSRMFELASAELTVVERNGLQLLAAVYAVSLRSRMSALIKDGESSMKALARHAATRVIDVAELLADRRVALADPELRSFDDVDSPSDLPSGRDPA